MVKRQKAKASPWLLTLFALPFAGVGLGFLVMSIIPSLYDSVAMSTWQPVQAQLISARTRVHHGDDSTSYEAEARYRYDFKGAEYESSRVGIMAGADNIGQWQETRGAQLNRALRDGLPITVYVDPDAPDEAVIYRELRWGMLAFKSVFVLVFGGVGLGLMWLAWRGQRAAAAVDEQTASAEPWRLRAEWANPVRSNTKLGLIVLWVFAVVWNGLSAPVLFALPGEMAKGNQAILFALLFPIIGLGLLVSAVVKLRQWLRFGSVPLHLDPWPACIGGQLAGRMEIKLPYDSTQRVHLQLSCLLSYYSGSGKNRKRTEKIIWSAEGLANLAPAAQGSSIQFAFDIPAGLPQSDLPSERHHLWRLEVNAALPGADFNQQYEVPVFETGMAASSRIKCASQHPLMQEERERRLERLLNIRQIADGVELYYQMGRRWRGRSLGLLVGIAMTIGGWFAHAKAAPLMVVVLLIGIGLLIAVGCCYGLLNSYRVKLGRPGIYTERKILGVMFSKRFYPPADIQGLVIKAHGSSQVGNKHTEHFVIEAQLNSGKQVRVVEDLDGRALTEQALEVVTLLSGLPKAHG